MMGLFGVRGDRVVELEERADRRADQLLDIVGWWPSYNDAGCKAHVFKVVQGSS